MEWDQIIRAASSNIRIGLMMIKESNPSVSAYLRSGKLTVILGECTSFECPVLEEQLLDIDNNGKVKL